MKHFNEISNSQPLNVKLLITAKYTLQNISEEPPFVIDVKKCDKTDNAKLTETECNNVSTYFHKLEKHKEFLRGV